jgi:hypothetical protein
MRRDWLRGRQGQRRHCRGRRCDCDWWRRGYRRR